MNIFSDYPDIINVALIPMIIAIFALGLPLLIQTITRIDDKYKSPILIKVFRKELITKFFLIVLLTSIFSYILWFLQIPSCVNWGWLIDNSALMFVIINTVSLIVMTFLITHLIYVYFVPSYLFNHFVEKQNKSTNKKEGTYYHPISKILNYSIQTVDEPLTNEIWKFYFNEFSKIREGKEGEEIVYPKELYDTFIEANEILCKNNKKAISIFNDNTIFDLFFDSYQKTIISQKTYSYLWRFLLQCIYYNRNDFVLSYWQKAHQLFNFYISEISPVYDNSDIQLIINQKEIDKRDKERKDFLEFHYALGALLVYKQRYDVVKGIMYFTHSQPPRYVLVPERMEEVVLKYMQVGRNDYLQPFYYRQKYWFPDVNGVDTDDVIKMWIKRYLAILFLRQYTLHEYYVNSQTLTMPQPPQELSELNRWKDNLDSLKYFVNEYLENTEILKALGLEQLSNKNWFSENKKIEPNTLLDNFKKEIEDKFNQIKKEQPISPDMESVFMQKTNGILNPIFQKYLMIFQNNNIGNEYQSYSIRGQNYILEKAAFGKNQDVSYLNSDSITAEAVAQQFQYYSINIFILIFPQKYLLLEKDLFTAVDNLKINSDEFVIISVGLYLDYLKSFSGGGLEEKEEKWFYKDIEIIEIDYMNDLVSQSLFVLKKDDLPNMIFKEITDKEYLKKYDLENIDKTFNIYAGLIDLNKPENEQIKTEIERTTTEKDVSQKVLACVDINVEIQCKKNTKCVQLTVFSQFDDRGNANKIEDVKNIWQEGSKK